MIQTGKRVRTTPLLIKNGVEPEFLKRIPTTQKLFQEDWLQKVIYDYPALLPAGDVESVFSPLISIGREISTNAGPIDNLFISPQGYLTIVETKLWRNPEARRVVVGQIVDYAKEVSKWSYEDLNSKVRAYSKSTKNQDLGVIDLIKESYNLDEEEESELIDSITINMKRGKFLLLIVGDGIRESVEDMAEYLALTPQLHFTLALVELKVFDTGEGRLILPQMVMRTQELTRAIIRIEGENIKNITVDMDLSTEKTTSKNKRFTLSEEEYFDVLGKNVTEETQELTHQLIEDVQDLGCEIHWRQSSFVVRYLDPYGNKQLLTLLVVSKNGEVYTGWLEDQLKKVDLPSEIGARYVKNIHSLFKGYEINPSKQGVWSLETTLTKYSEIIEFMEEFINDINSIET
ncbi:hypothetical protein [Gudongella sp. DL1XJH-153]|uniref:hypothetical protein n=1 Tax=Gudongella sp. DL1XJH-153 TaxID=3409804 RepID=UPI003BB6B415